VTLLVILVPAEGSAPSLGAEALRRLSEVGVTDVSLVQDGTTVGVLLAGWAFDPRRSGATALSAIGAGEEAQLLMPVMEAAVAAVDPPVRLTEHTLARQSATTNHGGKTL
jgi:hypothetical protein